MSETRKNTIGDYLDYFSVPGKPLRPMELYRFWVSLTEFEKKFYSTVKLG